MGRAWGELAVLHQFVCLSEHGSLALQPQLPPTDPLIVAGIAPVRFAPTRRAYHDLGDVFLRDCETARHAHRPGNQLEATRQGGRIARLHGRGRKSRIQQYMHTACLHRHAQRSDVEARYTGTPAPRPHTTCFNAGTVNGVINSPASARSSATTSLANTR